MNKVLSQPKPTRSELVAQIGELEEKKLAVLQRMAHTDVPVLHQSFQDMVWQKNEYIRQIEKLENQVREMDSIKVLPTPAIPSRQPAVSFEL